MGIKWAGTHEGSSFWINLECGGLFCASLTYFLISFGMYAFNFCVIDPWFGVFSPVGLFNVVLFDSMSLLAMYSHFKGMTTDPGAVPHDAIPLPTDNEENDYEAQDKINGNKFKKVCKRCRAFKPARAHHCSICKRCVIKMDHHCPWLNNCVGIGNHKLFLQFLLWINLICIYAIAMLIARYVRCGADSKDECGTAKQNLMSLFLLIEGALFGLFTICMKGDQLSMILSNQTQVDRLKNFTYTSQVDVNEVFGCSNEVRFQMNWLYPIPIKLRRSVQDEVYGFTVDMNQRNLSSSASHHYTYDSSIHDINNNSGNGNGNSSNNGNHSHSMEMIPLNSSSFEEDRSTLMDRKTYLGHHHMYMNTYSEESSMMSGFHRDDHESKQEEMSAEDRYNNNSNNNNNNNNNNNAIYSISKSNSRQYISTVPISRSRVPSPSSVMTVPSSLLSLSKSMPAGRLRQD